MRIRPRAIGAPALILCGLAAALAGCSTGPSYTTGSLRPREGMVGETPQRTYPDGSYRREPYDRGYGYAPRQYTDPGTPTPPSYRSGSNGYGASGMETGSIGARPAANTYAPGAYGSSDPNARWRQTPPDRWAAPAQRPQYAPVTAGAPGATPHIVRVREGDTLFSLSRRYDVPVGDLMAANRLPNERIAIGQELTIPIRYR